MFQWMSFWQKKKKKRKKNLSSSAEDYSVLQGKMQLTSLNAPDDWTKFQNDAYAQLPTL